MAEFNEERRTVFYDPQLGWTEQETPEAKLKLTSLWRTPEVRTIVENQLYLRFDRGGWQDLGPNEETQLSGREKGFEFECRPRAGEEGSFVEVRSVRFVDQAMKPILEGIPLFSLELKPIKPPMAMGSFCIPASSMALFQQRVAEQGGRIQQGQAELQVLHTKLTRLSSIAAELEGLCSESRAVIDQVSEKNFKQVPSIEERRGRVNSLYSEAGRLNRDLQDGKLAAQDSDLETQAHAAAYAENAEQWMTRIEQLHREHVSYEAQAMLRSKKSISQGLPGVEFPASTARSMLVDVVEFYTEQGFDARLTNSGMIITLGDTIIELGEKPSVRKAGAEISADQVLGQGGERGQREL